MAAGVAAFVLTSSGLTGAELAAILSQALPKMTRLVQTRVRPFVAGVSRSGSIQLQVGGARRGSIRRES
jgi:hypothetical protein